MLAGASTSRGLDEAYGDDFAKAGNTDDGATTAATSTADTWQFETPVKGPRQVPKLPPRPSSDRSGCPKPLTGAAKTVDDIDDLRAKLRYRRGVYLFRELASWRELPQ